MINLSYELDKIEQSYLNKIGKPLDFGSPERSLSDLARIVYLSWWRNKIIEYIM